MKNIILILITMVLASSCSDKHNIISGVVINTTVEFNLLNEKGEDLLNPSTLGYFPAENIKLYYLVHGNKVEVYNSNMASPRNIMLITETNPFRLRCFTNDSYEEFITNTDGIKTGISVAYIEFNKNDTDTIKTEWSYTNKGKDAVFSNDKVWYNGVLQTPKDSVFQITKLTK